MFRSWCSGLRILTCNFFIFGLMSHNFPSDMLPAFCVVSYLQPPFPNPKRSFRRLTCKSDFAYLPCLAIVTDMLLLCLILKNLEVNCEVLRHMTWFVLFFVRQNICVSFGFCLLIPNSESVLKFFHRINVYVWKYDLACKLNKFEKWDSIAGLVWNVEMFFQIIF